MSGHTSLHSVTVQKQCKKSLFTLSERRRCCGAMCSLTSSTGARPSLTLTEPRDSSLCPPAPERGKQPRDTGGSEFTRGRRAHGHRQRQRSANRSRARVWLQWTGLCFHRVRLAALAKLRVTPRERDRERDGQTGNTRSVCADTEGFRLIPVWVQFTPPTSSTGAVSVSEACGLRAS